MTHTDREGMGASASRTALAPASQVKPASGLEQSRSSTGAIDPMALQALSISALCDDLFDLGAGKATGFRRLDALHSALGGDKSE